MIQISKIISFSLWGKNPKYTIGAIKNAELTNKIYPGWFCKFFIGQSVPSEIIKELSQFPYCILEFKNSIGDWTSMFWRFETCYDPNIQISIFRDTDSRLSMREKYAVDEWLNSDKTFHIMRDHPYHKFPILGGMWGYKNNNKYPMKELLSTFDKNDRYGTDYEFFGKVLYPIIAEDKIVHDPFFDRTDFPSPRENTEFVGDVFDEYDKRDAEFHKLI